MGLFSFLFGDSDKAKKAEEARKREQEKYDKLINKQTEIDKNNLQQARNENSDSKVFAIKELLDIKGDYFLYLPEDFASTLFQADWKGKTYISVSKKVLDQIRKNREEKEKDDALYNNISKKRIEGKEIEKNDPEKAIMCYKEAIDLGENADKPMFHAYAYAYERLFVLLHKSQPELELQYLEEYLKHDLPESTRAKYEERYAKLKFKSL